MAKFRLVHGDCVPVLAGLPRQRVAIISDPPYGINLQTDYKASKRGKLAQSNDFAPIVGDDKPFDPSHLLGFETVVLFGANNFASKLPDTTGWIVWDKRDGMTSNDQSDCEIAWTNRNRAARLFRHRWNGMIKDSEKTQRRLHPTQKPVALFRWVITLLGIPSDFLIVDPYMGSGACGVAAGELGYDFLGCEIVEQYFKVASKRITAAFAQQGLFNQSAPNTACTGLAGTPAALGESTPKGFTAPQAGSAPAASQ